MAETTGAFRRRRSVMEFVMLRVTVAAACVALMAAGCAVDAAPSMVGGPIALAPSSKDAAAANLTTVRGDGTVGQVTIDSRYGHGTVSGPVRRGAKGFEVRMPGGTWIDCARNCGETLRRETVDFWESRGGRNDPIDGPAYFSWRW